MTDNPHLLTPEEADKMKCPMTFNSITTTNHYRCLGPECMAWRWKEDAINLERHTITGAVEITGSRFVGSYSTTHGYCGMVQP